MGLHTGAAWLCCGGDVARLLLPLLQQLVLSLSLPLLGGRNALTAIIRSHSLSVCMYVCMLRILSNELLVQVVVV